MLDLCLLGQYRISRKAAILTSCWAVSKNFDLNNSVFLDVRWKTNEALIISILAHRNAAQCKSIQETYSQSYGEDLLKNAMSLVLKFSLLNLLVGSIV